MHTRFIPQEEINAVVRWQFSAVNDVALGDRRSESDRRADSASQLLQLEQARAAGLEQGRAEGYDRAAAEFKAQMDDFHERQARAMAERLALCAQAFESRWEAAEQDVAQGVLDLACALARQVVRRELRVDTRALEPVIREALGMLATDARPVTVRLNPQDYGLLEAALRESFAGGELAFRPDAVVTPGGCLVEAGGMTIDGTLEKRWSRAVAALGLNVPWHGEGEGDA